MGNVSIEIQEISYRESKRINQSFLKDVIKNVTRSEDDKPTEAMEDGTVVDCLITTPELFSQKYIVKDVEVPEKMYKQAMDEVLPLAVLDGLDIYRGDILEAYRRISSNNWKDDTVWSKIVPYRDYWDCQWEAINEGKKVLSLPDYENYSKVAAFILSGKTGKWLTADGLVEEIKYQLPVYFDYVVDGITYECKALLDAVKFNHRDRTIRPIDIKTTGGSTKYWSSIAKKLRYDIQCSFYTEALKFAYPDWNILPFVFLVESIKWPGKPRDFVCTEHDLFTGKYGCSVSRGFLVTHRDPETNMPMEYEEVFDTYLGFEDALRIYNQSQQFGLQDYDVDYYVHVKNEEAYQLNLFL